MYERRGEYIPKGRTELLEYIAFLVLSGPKFVDHYFPDQTLDSVFDSFAEGVERVQKKLGSERHALIIELSNKAREHYRRDPDKTNGGTDDATDLLLEIEELIKSSFRRS